MRNMYVVSFFHIIRKTRMTMETASKLKFPQQQRLLFVESMLLWEGGVQRQRVSDLFRVSKAQITRDLDDYNRSYPRNIEYDLSAKTYRPGLNFKPEIASGRSDEYLALLQAYSQYGSAVIIPALGSGPSAEVMPSAQGLIDRTVLQRILAALRDSQGIQISYADWTDEKPVRRQLWPHTLVFNGHRWHVRAYDDRHRRFADFALARLSAVELTDAKAPGSVRDDVAWQAIETVEVIPGPGLSLHQQQWVAKEFGMKRQGSGWVWSVRLRQCLIGYFLHRYRLDGGDDARRSARITLRHPERFRHLRLGRDGEPPGAEG